MGTKEELAVLRYREEEQDKKIKQLQRQLKQPKSKLRKLWYGLPVAALIFLYLQTDISLEGLKITKTGLILLGAIHLSTLVVIYAKHH